MKFKEFTFFLQSVRKKGQIYELMRRVKNWIPHFSIKFKEKGCFCGHGFLIIINFFEHKNQKKNKIIYSEAKVNHFRILQVINGHLNKHINLTSFIQGTSSSSGLMKDMILFTFIWFIKASRHSLSNNQWMNPRIIDFSFLKAKPCSWLFYFIHQSIFLNPSFKRDTLNI